MPLKEKGHRIDTDTTALGTDSWFTGTVVILYAVFAFMVLAGCIAFFAHYVGLPIHP